MILFLFAVGGHALPTVQQVLHHPQSAKTLRLSGGSPAPLLTKSTVFNTAIVLFGIQVKKPEHHCLHSKSLSKQNVFVSVQGIAQTIFKDPTLALYSPGVKYSPSHLLLVEITGEKQFIFGLILYLLRWHPLLSSLSYALLVDAVYDGHVIINHANKLGLNKTNLAIFFLVKAIGAVLGFNHGFGKIKSTHIIRAFSVFWSFVGLFAVVSPNLFLQSFGTRFLSKSDQYLDDCYLRL